MCGLTGVWSRGAEPNALEHTIGRMTEAVRHRGPDDDGRWLDRERGLALGHRRLAIIDLSPEGHQPMLSASGRYVLVFNGEVYNFAELRAELLAAGFRFRGHSDTEVILAAVEAWGVVSAVRRFVGMFALALWDRAHGRLHLLRDRLGIKPLYYGWLDDTLVFASELKAIRRHPHFRAEIDREAIAMLLRYNCVPAPHSIYRGIRKLLPGTILTLENPGNRGAVPVPFWAARDAVARGVANPFTGTDAEAIQQTEKLLGDAVGLRMIADVPLGAFLSGGVDSSLVVALMQAQSGRPVKTFSIGFDEAGYNEAPYAAAVARHLGTDHTELYVSPEHALAVIPQLPTLYDEPFSDSSQIPTVLVSELARRHVTVSLSGDGGDELFGGYNRYVWGARVWNGIARFPHRLRRMSERAITRIPPDAWDGLYHGIAPLVPSAWRQQTPGKNLHKLAGVLSAENPQDLYRRLASHWTDPAMVVLGASDPPSELGDPTRHARLDDFTAQMMYWDLVTYLPDDILTKVDRASMAVSLEARVPLLDHRVVEFAWRLPMSMKIRGGTSKWILRQILYRHVPKELIERPKAGFGIPMDRWLRGPLREWAEALLDEKRLREEGFFDPGPIRRRWTEHLAGEQSWHHHIWDVLMFQAWLEVERQDIVGGQAPAGSWVTRLSV